jgi:inner membrane transporter RhtA
LGIAALGAAILSVQIGASFAKDLISQMANPTGATWLRLASAGVVMGLIWLIRRAWSAARGRRGGDIEVGTGTVVKTEATAVTNSAATTPLSHYRLYAIGAMTAMVAMNWTIWEAFSYLPIGIAVTLEFLGPLTLAIIGSRTRRDLLWALLAGVGVTLLGFRPEPLSFIGVVFGLLSACCWAAFTYCGSRAGEHYTPSQLLTPTWVISGTLMAIPALATGNGSHLTGSVLLWGLLVGVMNSVLPHSLELFSLGSGHVSPALFGILQSTAPAVAALGATLILHESLTTHDWAAIAMIIAASVGATLASRQSVPVD